MKKQEYNALSVGEQQGKVSDFVGREVHYCASQLISALLEDDEECKHTDDLCTIMSQDDWEERALDHANNDDYAELSDIGHSLPITWEDGNLHSIQDNINAYINESQDNARKYCEMNSLDPYTNEALEHWIVSDYLADKLEEQGEMVIKDFLGLSIWGRTCSGQAIALDCNIVDIYKNSMLS